MNINPGGTIPPEQVIGRDAFIASLYQILEGRSITLLAPRRVGKSCILRKLQAETREGVLVLLTDLQGCRTVDDFVSKVYEGSYDLLSKKRKAEGAAAKLIRLLSGKVEFPFLKLDLTLPHSLGLLEGILEDLQAEAVERQVRVVLCWDEFTYFMHDAVNDGHGRAVGQLLDRLRNIRNSYRFDRIRMIYTGSIGLEAVMYLLAAEKYTGKPFNDTERLVVPLLEQGDAEHLARALVRPGTPNLEVVGRAIAAACEGHPYFIHRITNWMHVRENWSLQAVEDGLTELLHDSQDPLELSQYIERLDRYHGAESGRLARGLLDALVTRPHTLTELLALTKVDREDALRLLNLLRRDLYVERNGTTWCFRLRLLQRYWRVERGLEGDA